MTETDPTSKNPDLIIKAHCNNCIGSTNHFVIHTETKRWTDGDEQHEISGGDEYALIRCAGCDTIHLKHESWFSEDWDEDGPIIKTVYYPPSIARRRPNWLGDPNGPFFWGETEIEKLLAEIYSALQNDSRRLAAMGIRALLEAIMIEQVGDSGQIGANVDKFLAEGHVAKKHQDIFRDRLIEAGHAAMHRKHVPSSADIDILLEITESIIASIYVHPHKAKSIGAIPARNTKKPIQN